MFAIIEVGAKQYKVSANDVIYDDKIGKPYLAGASVECEVQKQGKQEKIVVIHHISQKHHTRKYGHRQPYTKLLVKSIKA